MGAKNKWNDTPMEVEAILVFEMNPKETCKLKPEDFQDIYSESTDMKAVYERVEIEHIYEWQDYRNGESVASFEEDVIRQAIEKVTWRVNDEERMSQQPWSERVGLADFSALFEIKDDKICHFIDDTCTYVEIEYDLASYYTGLGFLEGALTKGRFLAYTIKPGPDGKLLPSQLYAFNRYLSDLVDMIINIAVTNSVASATYVINSSRVSKTKKIPMKSLSEL